MKEDFEGKLRNIVKNTDQPVDVTAMWRGIEDKMARKKRRRGFLWILFSLGILALVFAIFSDSPQLSSTEDQEAVANSLPIKSIEEINIDHSKNSKSRATSPESRNQNKVNRQSLSKEIDTKVLQNKTQISEIPQLINFENRQVSQLDPQIFKTNAAIKNIRQSEIIDNLLLAKEVITSNPTSIVLANFAEEEKKKELIPRVDQIKMGNRTLKTSPLSLWLLHKLDSDIPKERMQISVNHDSLVASAEVFGGMANPVVSIDRMTGISFVLLANRGSKTIPNVDKSPYLSARNTTESFLDMYSLSTTVELLKWKGLSVRSGLGYNYLTDVFEWEGDIVKKIDTTYLAARTFALNQDVVDDYETGLTKVRFERYVEQYNEYHLINLPIGIAYEHSLRAFSVGMYANVNFSYLRGNEVKYLQQNLNIETRSLSSQWLSPFFCYGLYLNHALPKDYEIGITIERKQFEITSLLNQYEMWGIGLNLKKNW